MTITAKPQNKKTKNKTLKIRFGLASKDVFLVFLVFFWFFLVLKCKNKNQLEFFWFFWRFMVGENHRKQKNTRFCLVFAFQNQKQTKKTRKTQKKTSFEAKPSSLFKVCFFFWGLAVLVILYILQAFRYTKITNRVYICLYYLCVCVLYVLHIYIYIPVYICMCVLKDMIQEALRWISGGVYYIYTSRQWLWTCGTYPPIEEA